jgi:hypothetical protein
VPIMAVSSSRRCIRQRHLLWLDVIDARLPRHRCRSSRKVSTAHGSTWEILTPWRS